MRIDVARPMLRARGSLSYPEFLRLLTKIWMDSHPDIPVIATGTKNLAQYPIITYRLDLRKAHPAEPKPKYREEIPTDVTQDAILISGQRFQNVITFTATTQEDPHKAEEVIEEFQNFMLEFIPVFKELGASELVFMRRLPDSVDSRPGEGIVSRSVSYLLTTETIKQTRVARLEEVLVDARVFLDTDQVVYSTNPAEDTIIVYGYTFKIGDQVQIFSKPGEGSPLTTGNYLITNVVAESGGRQYELSKIVHQGATPSYEQMTSLAPGTGYIAPNSESDVLVSIEDDFQAL